MNKMIYLYLLFLKIILHIFNILNYVNCIFRRNLNSENKTENDYNSITDKQLLIRKIFHRYTCYILLRRLAYFGKIQ